MVSSCCSADDEQQAFQLQSVPSGQVGSRGKTQASMCAGDCFYWDLEKPVASLDGKRSPDRCYLPVAQAGLLEANV